MADDITQRLAILTVQFNRIVPIFQIILGTFGNIMNILIFTRRTLRKNPCSTYFLALSINNIFVLYVALLTRLLSSGWNIDPSNTHNILCKLRIFFVYISLCLTPWFIVLASIDRFLSSCHNVHYRQLSNISIARKLTISIVIITTLAHFHTLIWWSSEYVDSTSICNIFDPIYDIVFSIFYILFTCLLPPCLMMIFGIKTIINVRKLRRQVVPQTNNERNEHLHSKDRQMITMLLFQVLITIICTTPFTAINLYSTINANIEISPSSPFDTAVYNFSANICRLLNYFSSVTGFYIYTLASRTFRNEMKCIFQRFSLITGPVQCLSEDTRKNLFQQSQTLANNQSLCVTRTRIGFPPIKKTNVSIRNQLSKNIIKFLEEKEIFSEEYSFMKKEY